MKRKVRNEKSVNFFYQYHKESVKKINTPLKNGKRQYT
jgi:hypothetical protein